MSYRIRTVDVFTDRALAGNQLAVVLGADGIPGELMQAIAKEMNLSETVFVLKPELPGSAARVRIFTPGTELPFAGHPTIGTAWVLWDEGLVPWNAEEFVLEEGVGPVRVRVDRSGPMARFWMTHPAASLGRRFENRAAVAGALGLGEEALVEGVPIQAVSTGVPFTFVALRGRAEVDAAISDGRALAGALGPEGPVQVFLFAATGPGHLYSRMFWPESGIVEDPATGSASGPLGAFAVRYGLVPVAEVVSIVSEQGTKMGRQSFVHIELAYPGDGDVPSRIEVGGSAVPVLSGTIEAGVAG